MFPDEWEDDRLCTQWGRPNPMLDRAVAIGTAWGRWRARGGEYETQRVVSEWLVAKQTGSQLLGCTVQYIQYIHRYIHLYNTVYQPAKTPLLRTVPTIQYSTVRQYHYLLCTVPACLGLTSSTTTPSGLPQCPTSSEAQGTTRHPSRH